MNTSNSRAEIRQASRLQRQALTKQEQQASALALVRQLQNKLARLIKTNAKQITQQTTKPITKSITKHNTPKNSVKNSVNSAIAKTFDALKIALYLPNDSELDTTPFIHWCWQQNIEVYLPVVHPFSPGYLLFFRYQQNTQMINNRFGIPEPKLNISTLALIDELDIIFTPLVAFDHSGNRLGMGGGFYDRTLANVNCGNTAIIGLAHDCQQVPLLPIEAWDIPLPEIITPSHHYVFQQ
ncbi:MAG: 5-formyltetrahydrofolate cyclo-ligase [Thalassotalea sp.]